MKFPVKLPGAIALLAGLIAAPHAENVRFSVSAGTVLEKTFEIGSKFVLEKMTVRVDGALQPAPTAANLYAQQERRLVVRDQYLEAGPHRPQKLRRRYESLTGNKIDRMPLMQPGGKEVNEALASDLQGSTVMFTWESESGGFKPTLLTGETSVDLNGLDEDMDLRMFLPAKEVSAGDSWVVDAGVFDEILLLGGDLGLEAEEGSWFEEQLAELLEGDIKVAYRDRDDSGHANLAIEASLDFDGEIEDERGGPPMNVDGHVNMRGSLLWNVRAGHFQTFELQAEMELSMKTSAPSLGATVQVEMDMTLDMTISGKAQ